jgi:hypothetical protein
MSSQWTIRVAQQNLRRSQAATAEFGKRARELDVDVALLQEPYVYKGRTAGLGARVRVYEVEPASAAIAIFNSEIHATCLTDLSDEWRVAVHVSSASGLSVHLVSAYFQYSHLARPHIAGLSSTIDRLRRLDLVVGADLNAHSPIWGDVPRDERDYRSRSVRSTEVSDFVGGSGMRVAFDSRGPSVPTFSSATGESTPDATLFSLRPPTRLEHWRVHPDWCLSDHRLISFIITTSAPTTTPSRKPELVSSLLPRRFRLLRADWDGFDRDLRSRLDQEAKYLDPEDVNKKAEALQRAILAAAELNIPRIRPQSDVTREDSASARHKNLPEWWNLAHDATRKKAKKAYRDLKKAGSKRGSNVLAADDPENDPFRRFVKAWRAARNEYKKLIRQAKRSHWRSFVEKESRENIWGRHYRCVKVPRAAASSLADVRNTRGICALTSAEAAENLLDALLPKDLPAEDTPAQHKIRLNATSSDTAPPSPPIEVREVETALGNLKMKSSPGLDCITGGLLRKAWPATDQIVAAILSEALNKGTFPDCWKPGKMVILTKPGDKKRSDPKAYRPITLLPAIGKLFERILVNRIESHLENNSPLSDRQFGFRRRLSTNDAIHRVKTTASELPGKYVVGVLLDITGAFDHAWWPMIIETMKSRRVPADIIAVIASYFRDRRVVIDAGERLVWRTLQRGCPQGSVLGPLLWNILFDGALDSPMPEYCELTAYADDLLLLIGANSRNEIEEKAETALSTLNEWGISIKLNFAPHKTQAIFLRGGLNPRRPPKVIMNGQRIQFVDKARYLGMTISKNFDPVIHIRGATERARNAYARLNRLGGNTWGLNFRTKVTMYRAIFISIVTYASGAWAERAAQGLPKLILLRAQSAPLKSMTSSYNTAPLEALRVLAGVEPIDLVAQERAAIFHLRRGRSAKIAGVELCPPEGEPTPRATLSAIRRATHARVVEEWQRRWNESPVGLLTKKFLPTISDRLKMKWMRCSYWTTQFLTGHGAFYAYLHRFGFRELPDCPCGEDDQTSEHLLWWCPLLAEERTTLHDEIELESNRPPTHTDLLSSAANMRAFERFCEAYGKREDLCPT